MNAEKLMTDFLRAHDAIVETGASIRVTSPDDKTPPCVIVTVLDEPQMDAADRNVNYLFQLDCYAGKDGGVPEVNALARAVRASLLDLQGTHDEGVASRPWVTGGPRLLDTDLKPAREHKPLTVEVVLHS